MKERVHLLQTGSVQRHPRHRLRVTAEGEIHVPYDRNESSVRIPVQVIIVSRRTGIAVEVDEDVVEGKHPQAPVDVDDAFDGRR